MKLSEWMTLRGETPDTFGPKLGVRRETVRRYLKGTRIPSWDVMPKLVELTGGAVGPADFLSPANGDQQAA